MAKKKSKTVKKASKSRVTKKKASSGSSTSRGKSTAKKTATRKKTAAKKVTKKKTAATKKPTAKKPTTKKAASKKPTTKKVTKKKVAGKPAPTKKVTKKKVVRKPAPAFKRTAGPKPSSISAPRPAFGAMNGNGEETEWTPAKLRRVKTGLTKKDYNFFLALLLERRAEIVGDVASLEAARRAQDGDISHVPLHMADVGSDNYEQEFTLGLMETERKMLVQIDEAITRIQDKTYGVCLQSGQPIPRARLEIKPWAKYTIEVVRERERLGLAG